MTGELTSSRGSQTAPMAIIIGRVELFSMVGSSTTQPNQLGTVHSCQTLKASSIEVFGPNTVSITRRTSNSHDLDKWRQEGPIQNLKTGIIHCPKTLGLTLGCCIDELSSIRFKQLISRTRSSEK